MTPRVARCLAGARPHLADRFRSRPTRKRGAPWVLWAALWAALLAPQPARADALSAQAYLQQAELAYVACMFAHNPGPARYRCVEKRTGVHVTGMLWLHVERYAPALLRQRCDQYHRPLLRRCLVRYGYTASDLEHITDTLVVYNRERVFAQTRQSHQLLFAGVITLGAVLAALVISGWLSRLVRSPSLPA